MSLPRPSPNATAPNANFQSRQSPECMVAARQAATLPVVGNCQCSDRSDALMLPNAKVHRARTTAVNDTRSLRRAGSGATASSTAFLCEH